MSTLSPNMGLLISTIGVDSGLLWEQNLNASELILDGHNHIPGFGVQIPPAGLNINSALTFNNQPATNLQAAIFTAQASYSINGSIYFSGVDLYANDLSGNVIKVTSGGSVNATTSGISSGTATAAFVSSVLVVNSATATPANIQAGSLLVGNNTANSNFCALQVPAALAANYNFVLPPGYPGATSFLQMDTSGNVTGSINVSGGISTSNIAANAVTRPKLAAVNQQISPSSGSFTTNSTTFTGVTNLAVTITTSGRPVMLMLQSDGGGVGSSTQWSVSANHQSFIQILRGATVIANYIFQNTGLSIIAPPAAFLDTPAAGTYTYDIQMKSDSAGAFCGLEFAVLIAYEL